MIELSNDLSATRPHSGGKWDNSWLRLNFCGDIRCFDQLPALKFYENPPLRSHMTSLRMRPSSYRRRTARLDELVVKNAPAISNPAITEASRLYRFVFDKAWPITTFCKRIQSSSGRYAPQQSRRVHVRFWSGADIPRESANVRFTPKSEHPTLASAYIFSERVARRSCISKADFVA